MATSYLGQRFRIRNQSMSGEPIIEGIATVRKVLKHWPEPDVLWAEVWFDGDDESETYDRHVLILDLVASDA